jgi:hypothetical protein
MAEEIGRSYIVSGIFAPIGDTITFKVTAKLPDGTTVITPQFRPAKAIFPKTTVEGKLGDYTFVSFLLENPDKQPHTTIKDVAYDKSNLTIYDVDLTDSGTGGFKVEGLKPGLHEITVTTAGIYGEESAILGINIPYPPPKPKDKSKHNWNANIVGRWIACDLLGLCTFEEGDALTFSFNIHQSQLALEATQAYIEGTQLFIDPIKVSDEKPFILVIDVKGKNGWFIMEIMVNVRPALKLTVLVPNEPIKVQKGQVKFVDLGIIQSSRYEYFPSLKLLSVVPVLTEGQAGIFISDVDNKWSSDRIRFNIFGIQKGPTQAVLVLEHAGNPPQTLLIPVLVTE